MKYKADNRLSSNWLHESSHMLSGKFVPSKLVGGVVYHEVGEHRVGAGAEGVVEAKHVLH